MRGTGFCIFVRFPGMPVLRFFYFLFFNMPISRWHWTSRWQYHRYALSILLKLILIHISCLGVLS